MIVGGELRQVDWLVPAGGAARSAIRRSSILLALVDDRGRIAFGEAAPWPGVSRETVDDARRDLDRWLRGDPPACSSPAAHFAFETALLGLRAAERSRSLHAELNAAAVERVPVAAVVDTPAEALAAAARGIATLKIKVGPGAEHAFAIHRAVPTARLRIDANRAWTRDEAAAQLRALMALPIDFVEEPCPDAHLTTWPVPIALDESLATMTDDEIESALHTVDALVLKPTLLGGLARCELLAAKARRAGKRYAITHCLEGPIGTAACAELALALGGEPAGLAPHGALAAWELAVPQLGDRDVRAASRPGLGFELASLDELVGKVHRT